MSKGRVLVGMSGGVDSSVAAYLLIEQGYEVIGIFMKNWHDDSVTISNECPWVEDSNDALIVSEKLGIPFKTLDFSEAYKDRIVDYMFDEYEQGRTPNPDVLCNREIKYDLFLKAAERLNADFLATGHYCRKGTTMIDDKETYSLLAGKDDNKDQSYFLCQLTQEQLSKALFPIGELQKSEVRRIAKEAELITAEKKDSQGLCFIGKVRLPDFLQQKLHTKEGTVIEIPHDSPIYKDHLKGDYKVLAQPYVYQEQDGEKVGTHQGAHFYTIGQRKGLGIGGKPLPLFVIATDVTTNTIYVGQGAEHPGLNRKGLFVLTEQVHWVREDLKMKEGDKREYLARIRYRQDLSKATLYLESDKLYITFETLQQGISPGQFVAWYDEDELIGSGVIS